jgi:hypothetical protein
MKAVDKYCDSVVTELGAWKAKIYDVVRRVDKLPSGDKAKMVDQVNDLHIFIDELEERIDRLRRECPIDWKPDQVELETKMTHLKTTYKQVWGNISPGDIGG